MFAGKTVWEIFQVGGFTMYILLFCSLMSITILLERLLYYSSYSKAERTGFMIKIKRALKNGNLERAMEICKDTVLPFQMWFSLVLNTLAILKKRYRMRWNERSPSKQQRLERYISIMATIETRLFTSGFSGRSSGSSGPFMTLPQQGPVAWRSSSGRCRGPGLHSHGALRSDPCRDCLQLFHQKGGALYQRYGAVRSELIDLVGGE